MCTQQHWVYAATLEREGGRGEEITGVHTSVISELWGLREDDCHKFKAHQLQIETSPCVCLCIFNFIFFITCIHYGNKN